MNSVRAIGLGLLAGPAVAFGIVAGASQSAHASVVAKEPQSGTVTVSKAKAAQKAVRHAKRHRAAVKAADRRTTRRGGGDDPYGSDCGLGGYGSGYTSGYGYSTTSDCGAPETYTSVRTVYRPRTVSKVNYVPQVSSKVVYRPQLVQSVNYVPRVSQKTVYEPRTIVCKEYGSASYSSDCDMPAPYSDDCGQDGIKELPSGGGAYAKAAK